MSQDRVCTPSSSYPIVASPCGAVRLTRHVHHVGASGSVPSLSKVANDVPAYAAS